MSNNNSGGLLSGLLTGIAIGISLGLMYAPRPGREIRSELRNRAMELRDRAEEMGDDFLGCVDGISCELKTRIKKAEVSAM